MATAFSPPLLLRMEDRVREARRLAERFPADASPEPAEDWRADVSPDLEDFRAVGQGLVDKIAALFDTSERIADADPPTAGPLVSDVWNLCCDLLEDWAATAEQLPAAVDRPAGLGPTFLAELTEQLIDQMRYVIVAHPDWGLTVPDHLAARVWTVRIPPLAYLRAMANLFWSAIRHPLSETTIDLSTGRVLYRT